MTESPDRLERELARIGAEHDPPAGWEERVLAAIDEPTASPTETAPAPAPRRTSKSRRWWWVAAPAFALAAVAIGFCRPRTTHDPKATVAVAPISKPEVTFESSQDSARGASGSVGDTMTVSAQGRGEHQAIWIYRNARDLVAACPGAAACVSSFGVTFVSIVVRVPGNYTSVLLSSEAPLPRPPTSLDLALEGALRSGAQVERIEHVVR